MSGPTDYPGIDYRGTSRVNEDVETGIRYGLISANSVNIDYEFDTDTIYVARCGHCGNELGDDFEFNDDEETLCPHCEKEISEDDESEPEGTILVGDYEGFISEGNEIWVTKSPYYTFAQMCSPCAPGAGNLNSPCPVGPKTYCLGHEMFENETPYPVYSVETNQIIERTPKTQE